MKITSAFLLLSAYVLGAPTSGQGYLSAGFQRHRTNTTAPSSPLHRHAIVKSSNGGASETLTNKVFQYLVSFDLGSPGQSFTSALDTGSSDLWVYSSKVSQAKYQYDSSSSSSSKYVSDDFSIMYVDGSGANGDYYTDKVSWGGIDFDLQFAVTDNYENLDDTVFGVGFKSTEATTDGSTYDNLPYALKKQSIISSALYSLYLDDVNSDTGVFLLGAVDDSRYEGSLGKVPFTSDRSFNVDFSVNGQSANGVLDSGTSLTYLDDSLVSSLAKEFGASYDFFQGLYIIHGDSDGVDVEFDFSGTKITVPASELIVEESGTKVFGLAPASQTENQVILGDTFLRSAYVVYDLDNKQAGIAQAKYGSGSSIRVIGSGGL